MKLFILLLICYITLFFLACDVEKSEHWHIDNLQEIGGHAVTVFGDPQVVDTEIGKALKFDGEGDMLLVDFNPIGNAKEFTVEVVFKQSACYPENTAPRFIHIQDPDDEEAKRLMIELRVNEKNQCYLDGFLRTDTGSLTLIDENLVRPTNEWLHAAVTYKNGVFTTYINKEKQLTGEIGFANAIINPNSKVAIGGRMNKVSWFNGLIKELKVTPAVLEPERFTNAE